MELFLKLRAIAWGLFSILSAIAFWTSSTALVLGLVEWYVPAICAIMLIASGPFAGFDQGFTYIVLRNAMNAETKEDRRSRTDD